MKKYFLLTGFMIILGCAALTKYGQLERDARKHYEAKRFDQAVLDCVSSLKMKPEYDKAQALIQEVFPAANDYHQTRITELTTSDNPFRWDTITAEYEALVEINQAVSGLPLLTDKKTETTITLQTNDFSNELANAKTLAAEAHYQEGIKLSQFENIDDQKQAAKEFKAAMDYVPQYKDAADLYEEARAKGIKRMAIIPFEDTSGKMGRFGDISGMIVDNIVTSLLADEEAMEFLEIVSRDHLERVMREQQLGLTGLVDEATAVKLGNILGVYEILTGKITQIIYIPEKTIRKNVSKKANVVVRKEQYKDSEGKTKTRNIYGDVFARVVVNTKTAGAKITGSYNIIDVATTKLVKSETFTGSCDFKYDWATFSGDERALDNQTKVLAKKSETRAPVAEELVQNACMNLSNSLINTLKEYAK